MSSLASHEVATPDKIAREIDWRLLNIARHIPLEVMTAPLNEPKVLYEQAGVGQLRGSYVGRFMVRVEAQVEGYDGRLGFWKDYELYYGNKPHDLASTQPEELEDCPAVDVLAAVIHQLHDGFIQGAVAENPEPGKVISLGDRLPVSTLE